MPLAGNSFHHQPLIVIVGPTAVGKTGAAIQLGQAIDAEIISADSRQVYRYMDIGTAKPTPTERAAIPHHLIDMVLPDTRYTVAEFQADASALIDAVHAAHKIPMIVGGTGQYVTSLLEGWQIPKAEPNPELRADLEEYAEEHGWQGLLDRLRALDPVYADQVDAKNLRRVIRAIEVCVETGRPYSDFRQKHPPAYTKLEFVLTMERSALYDRADQRIDQMIEAGLVAEVESLIERGYDWHLPSMTSLGYLQIGQYLRGEVTLDEALAAMRFATHDFIRRQYTWFRKYNRDAHWIEIDSADHTTILDLVAQWWKTLRQT